MNEEQRNQQPGDEPARTPGVELKEVVREVLGEFLQLEKAKAEPAYKAELADERRKRETLERRLNEVVEESQRARQRAEEAERNSAIRAELQRLGVFKVELAFKAVKDEIVRTDQGNLVARDGGSETGLREYLNKFVKENPELLPARVTGGSGATIGQRQDTASASPLDLDRIKPGMDPAEMDRIRREIARIASQPANS
jgi:hypothetical protein